MREMTPLDQYLLQRKLAAGGAGPSGGMGLPTMPEGSGISDPASAGLQGLPVSNPVEGQGQFNPNGIDPRKKMRPYLGGM